MRVAPPYEPGDQPRMPRGAWCARAEGTQEVDVSVDATGHVTKVVVVSQHFSPATMELADGTRAQTSTVFEQEVQAWLKPRIDPPKNKDGVPAPTVYRISFSWSNAEGP